MALSIPLVCPYCSEEIIMGDDLARHLVGSMEGPRLWHEECLLRSITGGLNHLRGLCSCALCNKGEPQDPPQMTRREAARAAVDYYRAHQGRG